MKHGERLRRGASLSVVFACFICAIAMGDVPHRVRVEASKADPVARRLVSELQSSGLSVITVESSSRAAPSLAAGESIEAIVRVGPGRAIRVWWVDHDGAALAEPAGAAVGDAVDDDPWLPVVRAAELVRARLLPILPPVAIAPSLESDAGPAPLTSGDAAPHRQFPILPEASPPAAAKPTPEVAPPPPPPASSDTHREREPPTPQRSSENAPREVSPDASARFGVDLAGLLIVSPVRLAVPPAFDLAIMLRWMPVGRLAVRAFVAIPVVSPQLSASEGHTSVGGLLRRICGRAFSREHRRKGRLSARSWRLAGGEIVQLSIIKS